MKNAKKILIIIILLVTICALGYVFIRIVNPTIRGVVIETREKNLTLMDAKDEGLYNISIPESSNLQFRQGQEILVYYKYGSIIEQSLPAHIRTEDIKKITILKEKSNIQIPTEKLERVYNSGEKVLISIEEISNKGMSITIKDTNEIKHEYKDFDPYQILKKGIRGTYSKLVEKTNKKKDANSIIVNPNNTIKNTYNWKDIYGELESGEYKFVVSTSDGYMNIFIYFTIDENGKITYSKAECGLMF